jgi:hypothetical protein
MDKLSWSLLLCALKFILWHRELGNRGPGGGHLPFGDLFPAASPILVRHRGASFGHPGNSGKGNSLCTQGCGACRPECWDTGCQVSLWVTSPCWPWHQASDPCFVCAAQNVPSSHTGVPAHVFSISVNRTCFWSSYFLSFGLQIVAESFDRMDLLKQQSHDQRKPLRAPSSLRAHSVSKLISTSAHRGRHRHDLHWVEVWSSLW